MITNSGSPPPIAYDHNCRKSLPTAGSMPHASWHTACRRQPLTAAVITAASNWWDQPQQGTMPRYHAFIPVGQSSLAALGSNS